ncbi:hypothetical protein GCM10027443_29740 [Pontibacter brevis]
MKPLRLLPSLFFLALFSCKEVAPAPGVSDQLKGAWLTVSQSYRYYDASGQLVHEEVDSSGTLFDFDGYRVTITYGTGTTTQCLYTLLESNGRNYIELTRNGLLQTYEITSIGDSVMSWGTEIEEAECPDNGSKTAGHATTTTRFSGQ